MASLKLGDKVEYKRGSKWRTGTIHGVKKSQKGKSEVITGYLVDTGKDAHVDELTHDPRDLVVMERAAKIVDDPKNPTTDFLEATEQVMEKGNLPKSELITETMRQPEQVEVAPQDIRPAK